MLKHYNEEFFQDLKIDILNLWVMREIFGLSSVTKSVEVNYFLMLVYIRIIPRNGYLIQ